jgi:hydrogenase expression/formation protein HypD
VKYVDEYRDPVRADKLLNQIRRLASRRWVLMEVCGGQTHGLLRYGIEAELTEAVEMVHGPGCPVCVTPQETVDQARQLARMPGVILASFGDMLRVPGSGGESLLGARAAGGDVRIVHSPLDALALAQRHPDRQVVFLAVGFETTAPATALAVLQAERLGLTNFSLLVAHVRVQPAMELLMRSPECRVQGFLAAGHVCTVTGSAGYADFAARWRVPVVVTGFEPVDLLEGILECVRQLEAGRHEAANRYARSVRAGGNRVAQDVVDRVYEAADMPWRGLGVVPDGGLRLRAPWHRFDAARRYSIAAVTDASGDDECLGGDVLAGRLKPPECPAFGHRCTPTSPLGAPMVSSEGACAAYYRYHGASAQTSGE